MIASQPLFNPARQNLKHKTNVLNLDKVPRAACEMEFRPPSQRWNMRGDSVIPTLALAALIGLIGSFLFRIPNAAHILLVGTGLIALLAVPLVIPGFVAWACCSATNIRETLRRRSKWDMFRSYVVVPFLLWLIALAAWTTRWEPTAFLFLLVFAWPTTLRAADLMATHTLYYLSAQPRIDRATQVKWRSDWSFRFQGFSEPGPRRNDLTAEQRADFEALCRQRLRYRWGRWWLLAAWAMPIVWGSLLAGEQADLRRPMIGGGVVLTMGAWATAQARLCPGSWGVFRLALASWMNFEFAPESPPWMLNTPVGDRQTRRNDARLAVALIAMGLVPLMHGGFLSHRPTWSDWTGFILGLLVAFVLPLIVFVLATFGLTAPLLASWFRLLEVPRALEQIPDETAFDGYVRRIQESQNPQERKCLFVGFNEAHEYPVLLDSDLLFEHMHMLGATGIGKTALGLATLVIQLIRRGDGPVVVVDCKGDPAFFNTVRGETEKSGRKFKWFTNQPNRSTYIFNPFQQSYLDRMTLLQVVGLFIQSLNLHHGDDYGRAWFSSIARALLKLAFEVTLPTPQRANRRRSGPQQPRITSFRDLHETIQMLANDGEDFEAARHLCLIVEMLSEFEQLNLSPRHDPRNPAVRNAIHMPEVIRERQVVYFHLVGAIDQTSVAEIGRLAMYALLTAAMSHREETGQTPRCYFIADEAQMLVAQNIANVLAQARSHGVACVLSHQSMSQLHPPGGVDLTELVLNCTSVKQYFSARDPKTQRFLSDVSGEVAYFTTSWSLSPDSVQRDWVSIINAASNSDNSRPTVNISQTVGQRLTPQDIQDVNHDPNQSVFVIERGSGLSQFQGAFPMRTDFPIDKSEFDRRRDNIPWPINPDETITVTTAWPTATEVTITPKSHPGKVDDILKTIRHEAERN